VIEHRNKLPKDWRWMKLGEVCEQDRQIVEPRSAQASCLPYISLEHVESCSGRILREPSAPVEDEGFSTTFRFSANHVLYGKLRPYLNKVALPEFDGRCTTEMIPLVPTNGVSRDFLALLLRRNETVGHAMQGKTGSRMPRAEMDQLLKLEIPLPPLPEQKRIAAILNEQMAVVERARKAAEERLAAVNALPSAYLRAVFPAPDQPLPTGWRWVKLEEVCDLLPSRSVSTIGDAEVQAITTACLTETGFDPQGIKSARMWSRDISECTVSRGEVLVARSNTPELVGRCAMFTGQPKGVVASDLTIRLRTNDAMDAGFLVRYLSELFLLGFWRKHAGGASGSMKKITRTQVASLPLPLPPLPEQERIAAKLNEQMSAVERARKAAEEELATINALPAALLRRAFAPASAEGASAGRGEL